MTKKISFFTLGCKVNQYETQTLKEKFEENGYQIVGENDFAHVYVVNSCSVTGISDRKTRQFIRKTKRINPEALTALIGCYAETDIDRIKKMDEIDIILGTAEKNRLPEEVETMMEQKSESSKIVKVGGVSSLSVYDDRYTVSGMDSRSRAYVKIEDGCDRFCSFCVIPYTRGAVRSRPIDSILAESKKLIEKGYKELILTGINVALFGKDTGEDLIALINRISNLSREKTIADDYRIRLSSLEPTVINAEYVKRLVDIPKLCPHLHLSLQSGSDRILSSMGRRYKRRDYLNIVDVLKKYDPNYSITTDIITGFPGETESDFQDSMSIIKEVGFSKVHVFKYSKRRRTVAADMTDQISGEVKNLRSKQLITASESAASEFFMRNKGTQRNTLILDYDLQKRVYYGITDNDIEVNVESFDNILNKIIKIII